jgi:hypothetical protein
MPNILTEIGIPKKLVRLIKMYMHEISQRDCIDKQLSDAFTVHNGVNHGDALSSLIFNFVLGYSVSTDAPTCLVCY